jgi:hypothetical protein
MSQMPPSDFRRAPAGGAVRSGLAKDVSVGILSYRAHGTLLHSLATHKAVGLPDIAGEFFIYFNALCAEDERIAREAGVPHHGDATNAGIYGGFRRIAEVASKPYVLILENDVISNPRGIDVAACLESCVADMIEHGIPAFSLRSRPEAGQGAPYQKYVKCFPVLDPVSSEIAPQPLPLRSRLRMYLKHGRLDKFRGCAVFTERHPDVAQPGAIRKLPSGNYVMDSRYLNWSNQAVLVERSFFFDVVCRRVETHPCSRTVNGYQDIERSLNSWWWRRLGVPLGHAAVGMFTHARQSC